MSVKKCDKKHKKFLIKNVCCFGVKPTTWRWVEFPLVPTLTYTNEPVVPSKERVFINDNNTVFLGNVNETKIFHMKKNDTFFFYLWIIETIWLELKDITITKTIWIWFCWIGFFIKAVGASFATRNSAASCQYVKLHRTKLFNDVG